MAINEGNPRSERFRRNQGIDPGALDVSVDTIGGDRDALEELVQSFLEEVPELVMQIEAGAASADRKGLRRAAHTMKSSAADFGAGVLSATFRDIENHCRADEMDHAAALAMQVSGQYQAAETVLRQMTGIT